MILSLAAATVRPHGEPWVESGGSDGRHGWPQFMHPSCLRASGAAVLEDLAPGPRCLPWLASAEFIGGDGSFNEVELLLIVPAGRIVLEEVLARHASG